MHTIPMERSGIAPPLDEGILRAEGLQGPYYGLQPLSIITKDTSELMDDLRKEFISISTLVNAGAPVNQLPHEILLTVFLFLQATSAEDDPPDWTAVLLVCRRWFVVAATAPHFWRTLVVGKSLNLLRTGLVRSKGFSIGVSILKRDAVPETVGTILPHLHRLHSLSISSIHQRHKACVSALMTHPMPVLERLNAIVEQPISWVVDAENPSLAITRMPLTIDMFPRLRSLTVERIVVPPAPEAVYKQLTVLRLRSPQIRSYNTVVEILRSCVNVEELFLELGESGLNNNMDKVVLPRLRTLELRGWSWFLHDILQTIAIPDIVDLSIQHLVEQSYGVGGALSHIVLERGIYALLPPNHQTVLPIFASVTEVHAQAGESEDVLIAYAPVGGSQSERRRLSICMPVAHRERSNQPNTFNPLFSNQEPQEAENPRVLLRSLRDLSAFSVAPVETLHIEVDSKKVDFVNWRAVFSHFPLLRELEVTVQGHPPKPSTVLYALEPPMPPPSQDSGDPDPNGETDAVAQPPPPPPPPQPACPRLRIIRMRRFRATADPSDRWYPNKVDISAHVYGFLSKRRDAGCDALEELVLDLDCLDATEWSAVEARRAACANALQSLTGRLEYTERKKWRDVLAYKDD